MHRYVTIYQDDKWLGACGDILERYHGPINEVVKCWNRFDSDAGVAMAGGKFTFSHDVFQKYRQYQESFTYEILHQLTGNRLDEEKESYTVKFLFFRRHRIHRYRTLEHIVCFKVYQKRVIKFSSRQMGPNKWDREDPDYKKLHTMNPFTEEYRALLYKGSLAFHYDIVDAKRTVKTYMLQSVDYPVPSLNSSVRIDRVPTGTLYRALLRCPYYRIDTDHIHKYLRQHPELTAPMDYYEMHKLLREMYLMHQNSLYWSPYRELPKFQPAVVIQVSMSNIRDLDCIQWKG